MPTALVRKFRSKFCIIIITKIPNEFYALSKIGMLRLFGNFLLQHERKIVESRVVL